jgi:hypothetical protein
MATDIAIVNYIRIEYDNIRYGWRGGWNGTGRPM